jgi:predicted ATPase
MARPAQLLPNPELSSIGVGLAVVLDHMQGTSFERFDSLNAELPTWLPEFDRVIINVTENREKGFGLRRKADRLIVGATDLSEGSLFALMLLTLANLPNPPSLVAIEHPDSGIHPRLLRRVRDAIYRLAFPANDDRLPTQVIVTTHSPYFLDQFKDHPEEIVIANKGDFGVTFQRLSDRPRMDEILPEGPLGDLWYSGLLGGVPAEPVQP